MNAVKSGLKKMDMRAQVETRLAALQEEMGAARARVAALQDELEQVRAEERVRAKNTRRASNPAAELAGQARARVEALRQALLDVQRQRDESRALATEAEMILSKLKEEHNPNFNDEGVKAAVRAYEDFAARASGAVDYTRENEINEIARPDGTDHGIDFAQWEGGEVEQPRTGFVACIPDGLYNFMQSRWEPVRSTLVSNGILADTSSDADLGNSKAVQKAESAVRAAESTLNAKERDHRDQQQKLDKDYGPNHIFRPLEGQCISRDSGEYTYELCWLARTTQRSKKGGASSNMGDFKEFTTVAVDEVDADTGKVATVQRLALRYADGAHCWNGPSRSTLVVLQCGEADEIVKVSEDEKCVYSMQVRTPAACEEPDNGVAAPEAEDSTEVDGAGQGFAGSVKDEL
ncbi:hypothetical protein KEM52_003070 [Ascosphaera acerosa]|nr:hypothetical protein KEM52_003070 [Ascosphaera acerosa]